MSEFSASAGEGGSYSSAYTAVRREPAVLFDEPDGDGDSWADATQTYHPVGEDAAGPVSDSFIDSDDQPVASGVGERPPGEGARVVSRRFAGVQIQTNNLREDEVYTPGTPQFRHQESLEKLNGLSRMLVNAREQLESYDRNDVEGGDVTVAVRETHENVREGILEMEERILPDCNDDPFALDLMKRILDLRYAINEQAERLNEQEKEKLQLKEEIVIRAQEIQRAQLGLEPDGRAGPDTNIPGREDDVLRCSKDFWYGTKFLCGGLAGACEILGTGLTTFANFDWYGEDTQQDLNRAATILLLSGKVLISVTVYAHQQHIKSKKALNRMINDFNRRRGYDDNPLQTRMLEVRSADS